MMSLISTNLTTYESQGYGVRVRFRVRWVTVLHIKTRRIPAYNVANNNTANIHKPTLRLVVIPIQCLRWSKKEAGSLPQSEVECPLPRIFKFIFDLKMASFDAFLVVF